MVAEGRSDKEIGIKLNRSPDAIRVKRTRMNMIVVYKDKDIHPANVLCPFFDKYGDMCVCCEGACGSSVKVNFRSAQKYVEFVHKFCQNEWEECFLSKSLLKLYE